MRFADRVQAAEHLAQVLQVWRGRHPLSLAIARGALPMGRLLAVRAPLVFDAVGRFCRTFGQVDDHEAIALLRGARQGAPSSP